MDDPNEKDVLSDVKPTVTKTNIVDRDAHWGDVLVFMPPTLLTILFWFCFYYLRNFWVIIWFIYAVFPLLDSICPHDIENLSERAEKSWAKDKRFLLPCYTFWIVDMATYIWGIWIIYTGQLVGWKEWILFTYTLGNLCGGNSVNGHELAHKKEEAINKYLATIQFFKQFYSHWYIEHLYGHHMNVATENDPASSQKNEILYPFIFKSWIGGYFSAWKIENAWFKRRKRSAIHYSNRMIWFTTLQIIHLIALYHFLGKQVVIFQFWYAFCGIYLTEAVNYIRHYGLRRMKDKDGYHEKIQFVHSWNAPQRFTNYLLFKIERHSDHHYDSSRPYQILRTIDNVPTMPHGYSVGVLLSMIPPVWFAIMNPYVDAQAKGEDLKPGVKTRVQLLSNFSLFVLVAGLTLCMIFV